jgi:hypothetical protein
VSTITATTGSDTWVDQDHPNRPHASGDAIRLQSGVRRGYIHLPVTDVRGRTVLSATLTGHVRSGFASQTVTVYAVVDRWQAGKTTWNRQPAVGASVATAVGALSDGDAASLDVTALIQSVANGAKWRGVRLSTSAGAGASNWYAFDAVKPAWTLVIELSDAPEQPSDLRPNVGAVASSRPILAWSFTDLGGDSSEQGSFKVQADPAADEVSPAFDSGWVTSAESEFDLSSSAFVALASGASTQWRVMTRDADLNESEWSDWASFTYVPYPTLVVDSPTGGVIGDPTPNVVAHMTGETLTQWRVRVEDLTGDILWDSGKVDGTAAITVPKRDEDSNKRVIKTDDATYRFRIRGWGDVERAHAVGLPPYVEQVVDVVFDDDAGVITPGAFTAVADIAGSPRITFSWTRTVAPDAVVIHAGNKVYARLDSDDWTVSAGVYTWTDNGLARPYRVHHYNIRALESGVRSHASPTVDYTPKPEGVWLLYEGHDPVVFDGTVVPFVKNDRRATYKPVNTGDDVDIVYAFEGISGDFSGFLIEDTDVDVFASVDVLEDLRKDVYATPQLVWASESIPVTVRNLSPLPDGDTFDDTTLQHAVSFNFTQTGD